MGVKGTETADLGDETRVGPGPAPSAGGGTLGHEGGGIAALSAKLGFPAVEGSARDLEGVEHGQKAVGVPEPKDSETFLGIFGSHVPKMPQSGDPVETPDSVSHVLHVHGIPPDSRECQRFLNLCIHRLSWLGVISRKITWSFVTAEGGFDTSPSWSA